MEIEKTIQDTFQNIPFLQGWDYQNPDEKQYTCNDITTAYLFGREHGEKDFKKGLVKKYKTKFKDNVKKVQKSGADFYDSILSEGIGIKQLLLSITPNNFKLLYIITKDSFLSDKFDEILIKSHKIIEKNNNLDILFMPYNKSLNTEKLLSDGYCVHYEKKG